MKAIMDKCKTCMFAVYVGRGIIVCDIDCEQHDDDESCEHFIENPPSN